MWASGTTGPYQNFVVKAGQLVMQADCNLGEYGTVAERGSGPAVAHRKRITGAHTDLHVHVQLATARTVVSFGPVTRTDTAKTVSLSVRMMANL